MVAVLCHRDERVVECGEVQTGAVGVGAAALLAPCPIRVHQCGGGRFAGPRRAGVAHELEAFSAGSAPSKTYRRLTSTARSRDGIRSGGLKYSVQCRMLPCSVCEVSAIAVAWRSE
jgi:hypothetical protein